MLVWLTLPFYDFCGFRSIAINSVIIIIIISLLKTADKPQQ